MKYFICVLVFVSALSCTRASLLPFIFNPFQSKPSSSNNADPTTETSTVNEKTTEINETMHSDHTDQPTGTSESSNLQEGQEKSGDLQQLLTAPLNILNLIFGPHNTHPAGIDLPNVQQPQLHSQELLPGLPGLPIPLIGLPNLIATNSKPLSLARGITESSNSEEKSSNAAKN